MPQNSIQHLSQNNIQYLQQNTCHKTVSNTCYKTTSNTCNKTLVTKQHPTPVTKQHQTPVTKQHTTPATKHLSQNNIQHLSQNNIQHLLQNNIQHLQQNTCHKTTSNTCHKTTSNTCNKTAHKTCPKTTCNGNSPGIPANTRYIKAPKVHPQMLASTHTDLGHTFTASDIPMVYDPPHPPPQPQTAPKLNNTQWTCVPCPYTESSLSPLHSPVSHSFSSPMQKRTVPGRPTSHVPVHNALFCHFAHLFLVHAAVQ